MNGLIRTADVEKADIQVYAFAAYSRALIEHVIQWASPSSSNGVVVDLGCGPGYVCALLMREEPL